MYVCVRASYLTLIFAMFSNSTQSHFFLSNVGLALTSDMKGACLSLQAMKIDICGRSVALSHKLNCECLFWKAGKYYIWWLAMLSLV